MLRIAFFSDDDSGSVCAWMAAHTLVRLDGQVNLVLAAGDGASAPPPAKAGMNMTTLPRAGSFHGVADTMHGAAHGGGDFVMSLPLSEIGNGVLRRNLDVVVTVGEGQASAARALRAARYDTAEPCAAGTAPAWFLARSDQSVLMTKARLAPEHGPRLPFGTRALPMMLPRIGSDAARRLLADEPDDGVLAAATLLSALLIAIGSDPAALRLGAADLAAMMASRETQRERALADRLVGLADAYRELVGGAGQVEAANLGGSPHDRRRPVPTTAGRIAPKRQDRLSRWG